MKLTELKPKWEMHGEYKHLAFDCPKCRTHRMEIPLPPHPKAWSMTGETFENVTLAPSIAHTNHDADFDGKGRRCDSHFFIRNGEIQMT